MREKIYIRSIKNKSELEMILNWAKDEKWNPGKYDYEPYFELDKNGYLLLFINEIPVGSISLVRYSDEFSVIGLFIVRPEYRSKGYGKLLWEEALKRLEHCQTITLNSVPEQVSRYEKSDFKKSCTNERWSKDTPTKPKDMPIDLSKNPHSIFKQLCNYDKRVFKHNRKKLLTKMLNMPESCAFVTFDKASGKVNGYGMVRRCINGFRVSLYADDCESAKTLFETLISQIPGKSVILDMPNTNIFSEKFSEYFQLQRVPAADTIAMYKGEEPKEFQENSSKCYGLVSLEVG